MIPFNLCPFQSSLRPPLHKLHFICVSLRVPWERCIDNFLQKYDSSLFYRGKSNSAASNWIGLFSGVENDREREGTWPQTFYMGLLLNRDLIELQGTIDDNCITTWFLFSVQQRIFIYLIHPLRAPVWREGSKADPEGRWRQWGHEMKL